MVDINFSCEEKGREHLKVNGGTVRPVYIVDEGGLDDASLSMHRMADRSSWLDRGWEQEKKKGGGQRQRAETHARADWINTKR